MNGNRMQTALWLIVFFTLSAGLRFLALAQTPYANGWDGYFYLEQVKSLIERGHLHSPDTTLIYPYLAALSLFTSDYILALKIGVALLSGALTVSVYLLARTLSGNAQPAALLAALSVFSPTHTFLAAQFPKNLMAMVAFHFFLLAVLNRRAVWATLFFLLIFLTHRLLVGVSILFIVFTFVVAGRMKPLLLLALAAGALLVPLSIFSAGTLHISDLARLNDLFSLTPNFPPFAFIETLGSEKVSALWQAELFGAVLTCTGFIAFSAMPFLRRQYFHRFYLTIALLCSVLAFPFFKFDLIGAAYRFFPVFVLIAPLLLVPLLERLTLRQSRVFVIFFIGLAWFSKEAYQPRLFDADYARYEGMTKRVSERLKLKPVELVVAHKGLAEFYAFTTGVDAMSWLPEPNFDKTRVWRIAADVEPFEIVAVLGDSASPAPEQLNLSYVLVREDVWQALMQRVSEGEDEELKGRVFSWQNPSAMRPNFLMRTRTP